MSKSTTRLGLVAILRYGVEAALFFAFMGFFRVWGVDAASAIGGFIGRNILARTGVTERARKNLAAAFPEKSKTEIDKIIKEMWDNLGRTIAEYAHLDKFSIHGKNPRLEISNLDIAPELLSRNKGIIFVSGHFANWETMPFAAVQYGLEGGEVYRPVNNPFIDRWLVRQRQANGPKDQIAKGPLGTRRIFTLLRSGKAVYLLADQKTNEGIAAPFFGRPAMTTPAPAALALKLDAIVLPISNERLGGARFRLTIHPPIEFVASGDSDRDVLALTVKINAAIEQYVRARPSQWLWIHRRWPKPGDQVRSRRGHKTQALNS
ncbi:MAG TPA: lysophospholipid acyltransferase family protein [Rhizomicrobium sp.]|jgi:KDO2-lipid IV(A) lauroyltransferase|nr:lysophospholipid acyltransferase family protein [Rhizomicrobium sp.]